MIDQDCFDLGNYPTCTNLPLARFSQSIEAFFELSDCAPTQNKTWLLQVASRRCILVKVEMPVCSISDIRYHGLFLKWLRSMIDPTAGTSQQRLNHGYKTTTYNFVRIQTLLRSHSRGLGQCGSEGIRTNSRRWRASGEPRATLISLARRNPSPESRVLFLDRASAKPLNSTHIVP